MCGIAGFWLATREDEPQKWLEQMQASLHHRGPDERGMFIDGPVGLASRRLSILDLEQGRQPIFNEDRSVAVVYNGEIYNSPELRQELEQRGHRFTTRTDTEVLVHLYEEYGPELVKSLRGMFAFALYDRHKREMLLARDPFGIKPLIYAELPQGVFFASELRALLVFPGFPRVMDLEALRLYVEFNYIPAPFTIWKAARRLEPGCLLRLREGRVVEKRRYFQLQPRPWPGTLEEAVDELDEALRESVGAHLLSDVPVGAFLSGGLDSSLVCALAQRALPTPLRTFTVTFPEWPVYDESCYARLVSRHLGTRHEEIPVTVREAVDALNEVVEHLDEPFADSSLINVAIISKVARKHVKVVLSGDGGDEFFAGYNKYQGLRLAGYLSSSPFRAALRVAARLPWPERRGNHIGNRIRQFRKLVAFLHPDPFERYRRATLMTEPHLASRLLNDLHDLETEDTCPLRVVYEEARQLFTRGDEVNRWLWADVRFVLPYDMLQKVDTASMRYGLEVRVPLVDVKVAQLAFRLPGDWKLKGLERKWILKRVATRYLPSQVIRRPKGGFGIPVGEWLRRELRGEFEAVLSPQALQGSVWNAGAVQSLLREHVLGRRDRFWELWNVYVFERWRRKWAPTLL